MSKVLKVILVVLLVALVFVSGAIVGTKVPREPQLSEDLAIELAVARMNRHDLAKKLMHEAMFPPGRPFNEHPEETKRVIRATAKAFLLSPNKASWECQFLFGPHFMEYGGFQE
jgi:hypothetical protein